MLTEFLCQWNPFNIFGSEVGVEELLCKPLQPSETLRQDVQGRCRRIQVPSHCATIWEKAVFWVQTHLNEKGHLETIDKLISLFYQKLLQSPPQKTEKLQEFNHQINQLLSLKNDYGFTYIKTTNSSFIDSRLKEIEQHAYSIFSYYYKLEVFEQQELKKKEFHFFQQEIALIFQQLAVEHFSGLNKAYLLMMVPLDMLHQLIQERVQSIHDRLQIIQQLHQKINKIEKIHEGQFTVPFIRGYLKHIRIKLSNEVEKIKVEGELVIRNLVLNYHLTPFKKEVKQLLDSLKIDPEINRQIKTCTCLFKEALDFEIERIRILFSWKKREEKLE